MWGTCSIFLSATWDAESGNIRKEGKRQRKDKNPKSRNKPKGKSILITMHFPKFLSHVWHEEVKMEGFNDNGLHAHPLKDVSIVEKEKRRGKASHTYGFLPPFNHTKKETPHKLEERAHTLPSSSYLLKSPLHCSLVREL